jgi:ArsR family transcriptional regulator
MDTDKIEICKDLIIHREKVEKARETMPDERMIRQVSDFFKVLGEPTRIRILNILSLGEMCVCDLSAALGMNQSAVSHQLKILKQSSLVTYRKEGKVVYYSLNDDHVRHIYEQGLLHIKEKTGGWS